MSRSYGLNYAVGVFLEKTNGIGESKRAAKFAHGGVSGKIHSYATRARYCGIVKDFVEKMRSEGVRRVNQLKEEHVANYLHCKRGWATEKTMKVNMSALKNSSKRWGGKTSLKRSKLSEVLSWSRRNPRVRHCRSPIRKE